MSTSQSDSTTIAFLRRAMLAVLVLGVVGTQGELLLLKHYEDKWQFAPLILNGVALLVVGWHLLARSRLSVRVLQGTMGLYLLAGAAGLILHYQGNVEWELERTPGLSGFELVKMALTGATPTLAPGTMVQLGLIGLLYAFRHPALGAGASPSRESPS
jgi:hypothetical protein